MVPYSCQAGCKFLGPSTAEVRGAAIGKQKSTQRNRVLLILILFRPTDILEILSPSVAATRPPTHRWYILYISVCAFRRPFRRRFVLFMAFFHCEKYRFSAWATFFLFLSLFISLYISLFLSLSRPTPLTITPAHTLSRTKENRILP